MAVYVDSASILWKGRKRHHMTADSLQELHAFASTIDVKPCWFHRGARHPHYDVTDEQRERAIAHGAISVDSKQLVAVALRLRKDAESQYPHNQV